MGAPQNDGRSGDALLLAGRFEAQFEDLDSARDAARAARAVGFVVDVDQNAAGWLTVGRRRLPFPGDERDRYASRVQAIASQHGGRFVQFVEEPSRTGAADQMLS